MKHTNGFRVLWKLDHLANSEGLNCIRFSQHIQQYLFSTLQVAKHLLEVMQDTANNYLWPRIKVTYFKWKNTWILSYHACTNSVKLFTFPPNFHSHQEVCWSKKGRFFSIMEHRALPGTWCTQTNSHIKEQSTKTTHFTYTQLLWCEFCNWSNRHAVLLCTG